MAERASKFSTRVQSAMYLAEVFGSITGYIFAANWRFL
jgi:hypothetical protein